ncbi:PadR family transcriptional regulator [Clostridium sp. LIBA-8841]|uniref:PadR family transcriptional regulator n=1 Tax=Clostridium sp. LIBA-8841 TaxID=2987530 RepID=UPI002AC4E5F7|nr:helix-turn-helix transcriptional regulator [Clostridium sp. LIBA-8841]MDZ5254044.1 PadR family transcriptional regulator [Clostridium sp. LIBA-8841]
MPRKQFQTLTEQMYYILLSLLQERCGVDIMNSVQEISNGHIKLGPGTLYTLLSKFEKEKIIIETSIEGRKRSYIISDYGKEVLHAEYKRLNTLVKDGELFIQGENYDK